MTYTNEQFKEALNKLSTRARNFLSAVETANAMRAIGLRNRLDDKQTSLAAYIAGLTACGLITLDQITLELQAQLKITSDQAIALTSDIRREIIDQIGPLDKADFISLYNSLPNTAKNTIDAGHLANSIDALADQYYLETEQQEALKTEVALVMTGDTAAEDLAKKIVADMGLDEETAADLANTINRQILAPIMDLLDLSPKTIAAKKITSEEENAKNKFEQIGRTGRYRPEDLMARYQTLPPDIKKLIGGVELGQTISPLASKYELHVDQAGTLAELVILVMLGLIHPSALIGEIERGVGVTKIKAGDIAYELDQKVFKKIRDLLRQVHNQAKEVVNDQPATHDQPKESFMINPHPADARYTPPPPMPKSDAAAPAGIKTTTPSIITPAANKGSGDPYRELPN